MSIIPATVGTGKVVHAAQTYSGNLGVDCGAVRYRNTTTRTITRQPAGTEVTCQKCLAKFPVEAPVAANQCLCGCTLGTKGGSYLPGHDARHASQVAKALAAGTMNVEQAAAILSPRLSAKAFRQAGLS